MVFRVSHIGEIRFDEKLPLYSWQKILILPYKSEGVGELSILGAFLAFIRV